MPSVKERPKPYSSDLTEEQWNRIKDLLPSARKGGRPISTSRREILNAVLYIVNTGAAWRQLPRNFPPWQTIYYYFRRWKQLEFWQQLHDLIRTAVRTAAGRHEYPTYIIVDSQSIRATSGEQLAYDGFKKVRGRKRQIAVDTLGLLHGIYIHKADLSDTIEGHHVFDRIPASKISKIEVVNADLGYQGTFCKDCVRIFGFEPLMRKRENTGQGKKKGAQEKKDHRKTREKLKTPRRWIVERTFAWFNGSRRLTRDYEKLVSTSEAMIYIAMTQLMLNRLDP